MFCKLYGLIIVDEVVDFGCSVYKGDYFLIGNFGKFFDWIMLGDVVVGMVLVVEKMDWLSR